MTVLIAYGTKYGTTETVGSRLQEQLPAHTDLVNLRTTPTPAVDRYDVVLVGGSIYAGRIRPEVTKFCERHQDELLSRKVGVFISCLYDEKAGGSQIGNNFPGWLLAHAFGRYNVGGAVRFSQLRFIDRVIMQKVGKVDSDLEGINEEEIARIISDVRALSDGA